MNHQFHHCASEVRASNCSEISDSKRNWALKFFWKRLLLYSLVISPSQNYWGQRISWRNILKSNAFCLPNRYFPTTRWVLFWNLKVFLRFRKRHCHGNGDFLLKVSFHKHFFRLITFGISNFTFIIQIIIWVPFLLMWDVWMTRRPKKAESIAWRWTLENNLVRGTCMSHIVFGQQLQGMVFALQISQLLGSHAHFKHGSLCETAYTSWNWTSVKANKILVHEPVTAFFLFSDDFRYLTDKRTLIIVFIESRSYEYLFSF